MGRRRLSIDDVKILEMRSQGKHLKEISKTLRVSTPTLSRRIAELRYKEGILTKYRGLQGLQLTKLQFKALEAITDEKIENASLLELVKCFSVLAKVQKAIVINEKGFFKANGLVEYLLELERRENGG